MTIQVEQAKQLLVELIRNGEMGQGISAQHVLSIVLPKTFSLFIILNVYVLVYVVQ